MRLRAAHLWTFEDGSTSTEAIVYRFSENQYRQAETARLAKDMPHQTITVTQDETFTGGLCLAATEPVSNFILLEQLAQARDQGADRSYPLFYPEIALWLPRVIVGG